MNFFLLSINKYQRNFSKRYEYLIAPPNNIYYMREKFFFVISTYQCQNIYKSGSIYLKSRNVFLITNNHHR